MDRRPEADLQAIEGQAYFCSSSRRTLSRAELTRYLGYCSEMLALISKLAALHAERLQDTVVLDTVNDVETLTSGLSAKIW
jgi:hypothetical protein